MAQLPSSATWKSVPNDTVTSAKASIISKDVKEMPAASQYSPGASGMVSFSRGITAAIVSRGVSISFCAWAGSSG